jgi:hypothetical protein
MQLGDRLRSTHFWQDFLYSLKPVTEIFLSHIQALHDEGQQVGFS